MQSPSQSRESHADPDAEDGAHSLGAELRFVANRHLFRTMLAGSGAAAVVMHRVFPQRHWLLPDRRTVWWFAKLQARNLARLCGVTVDVRGLEYLAHGGPFVVTPNHQSHFDIVALLGFLPGENRFAAKQELFADPILGPVLRTLGMIPIDRARPLDAIERLRELQGTSFSLVIFPEGTRSRDGVLLPFKTGAFAAAIALGLPVVPVTVRGSAAVMPKGGRLGIYPGRVEIIVAAPVPTQHLAHADREGLRDQVRTIIARRLTEGTDGSETTATADHP
jgi:1-acyl-sn-glycerol-3-phosphate acyltransferase